MNRLILSIVSSTNAHTVILNGAPLETISWDGGSEGLDLNGAATVFLESGTYSFAGSVSGYTKSDVAISDDITVNVYPNTALYWYGKNVVGFTQYNASAGDVITLNTNSVTVYSNGTLSCYYATNAIDLTPYTSLKANITAITGSYCQISVATPATSTGAPLAYINATTTGEKTVDISSVNQSTFARILGNGAERGGTVSALWLE